MLKSGLHRDHQAKKRSFGRAPIQQGCSPCRRGKLGHRHGRARGEISDTQGKVVWPWSQARQRRWQTTKAKEARKRPLEPSEGPGSAHTLISNIRTWDEEFVLRGARAGKQMQTSMRPLAGNSQSSKRWRHSIKQNPLCFRPLMSVNQCFSASAPVKPDQGALGNPPVLAKNNIHLKMHSWAGLTVTFYTVKWVF